MLLAELSPRPKGTVSQIRDIVEAADLESDDTYSGHDPELIASLYPTIRIFETGRNPPVWSLFFRICIEECQLGMSWVESDLADTLRVMCDLDEGNIPFRVLCRSIFDEDPSSFFLALYRCIEAMFFYWSATNVVAALKISSKWEDVAVVLEDELGWHPREESSLEKILSMASPNDLKTTIRAFGENSEGDIASLVKRAAKKIYGLRNSIVHYRPSQHVVRLDTYNWNSLCISMAGIIHNVYYGVFHGRIVL